MAQEEGCQHGDRFLIEETKEEDELSQERHEVEVAGELTSSIIS